jgi:protein-tyrosine phosphatase
MANTTQEIFEFIEETLDKSESVLIHSARGQSRASAVIAIYMMKKYRWTLLKTLEFLNSRRPDLEIRASFIQQLNMFENYLSR